MQRYTQINEVYTNYKKKNNYLLEYTYKIGKDVDLLYNKYVKKELNNILNGKFSKDLRNSYFSHKDYTYNKTTSNILQSKEGKQADELNHVKIEFGVNFTTGTSYYDTFKKIVSISFNPFVVSNLIEYGGDINKIIDSLSDNIQKKMIVNELTESRVKGSIYHELSHWISDTFHNYHITDIINKAQSKQSLKLQKLGKGTVSETYYEIDALVHSIKQIKRNHRQEWDMLTLKEVGYYLPPLISSAINIYKQGGEKVFNDWQKEVIKRLDREKLLGKNMHHFLKIQDIM